MTQTQTHGRSRFFRLIKRDAAQASGGHSDAKPAKIYFTKGNTHYVVCDSAGIRII